MQPIPAQVKRAVYATANSHAAPHVRTCLLAAMRRESMVRRGSSALVVALFVAIAGCSHGEKEQQADAAKPEPVTITVAKAEQRPLETTIQVVGTLKGWEDVKVGAKRFGRVVRSLHDVGDRVAPGELLVQIETVNVDLLILQAEKKLLAELAKLGISELPKGEFDVRTVPAVVQAEVAVARARQKFEREQQLFEKKVSTLQAYQDADFDLKEAEAALNTALNTARTTLAFAIASKVEIDVAKQARDDTQIRAPVPTQPPPGISGPLAYAMTKRSISEGQMLREGDVVAELVIENPLRMWANVPERFSPDVNVGQDVRISVPSHPGKEFLGKISWVNPAIDTASRTFQVEVAVPNDERALRPGGFAKASIVTRHEAKGLVVPIEAIVRFAGVTKLFVVRDQKAIAIPVETGLEGDGWVEITGNVRPGADVVTSGHRNLADGSLVAVRKNAAPSKPRPGAAPEVEKPLETQASSAAADGKSASQAGRTTR